MKYINHMTCAFQDEKIQAAVAMGGLKVYGAFWVLVEAIGAQIRPESVSVGLTLTWPQWASKLLVDVRIARRIASTLQTCGVILLQDTGKSARIEIPNILKYADEYSRKVGIKSGHSPDTTPDKFRKNSGAPALPAFPALPEEKKDLRTGPVDNSGVLPLTDGADAGGGLLGASPPAAPPPGPRGNGVHPRVKSLNLTPEKEASVSDLYLRHQAERIRGDDISDALRGAGLDHGEIMRVASLFIG
ncbi:MAG: hypothetical protein M0T69_02080 [Deltaproteobacteria bacterium]|nr:hypothetical protein [Deltaproteobacteria bacterium]